MAKLLKLTFAALVSTFPMSFALATPVLGAAPEAVIHRGNTGDTLELGEALATVEAGSVVILGEQHNNGAHQQQHLAVLQHLRDRGLKVSLGMEFVSYPFQSACDRWLSKEISDEQFLKEIEWGGNPFSGYRLQMASPRSELGEKLIGLNAPRALTRKISRLGLSSLNAEELALMPPQFTLGNELYFERFVKAVGHLPNPESARNFFAAQSTWDDTMAWVAEKFLRQNPDQVLVIIVGEFHVQYGGGLPDRLRARGLDRITSFSQVNIHDLSLDEQEKEIRPEPRYGMRADYIWTSSFSE